MTFRLKGNIIVAKQSGHADVIEQIQLKRGLLRLREVTAMQLAAHTGVNPATAKSFLHDHPDLVVVAGSVPAERSGRPATVWKLRSEAEAALIEELRGLRRASETEFTQEQDESLLAANSSIDLILKDIEDLKRIRKSIDPDRLVAAGRRLGRRIAATRVALKDLKSAGRSVILAEVGLTQATGELDRLLAPDSAVHDRIVVVARDAVGNYFGKWIDGIRREISGFAVEDWISPVDVTAAPLLLVDGIGQVSDALSRQIMEAGRTMGAPVLHLAVGRMTPGQRQELFRKLGTHLALAAGAATQVVYTIDSGSDREGAKGLAQEFAALDNVRNMISAAAANEPSEPLAREVVSAVAPLIMGAGVAATGHSAGALPTVHPAGFMLAGTLNSRSVIDVTQVAAGGHYHSPNPQWDGHLHSVCMDSSTNPQLSSFFVGTGISYVAASSFPSVKAVMPGPLPFAAVNWS